MKLKIYSGIFFLLANCWVSAQGAEVADKFSYQKANNSLVIDVSGKSEVCPLDRVYSKIDPHLSTDRTAVLVGGDAFVSVSEVIVCHNGKVTPKIAKVANGDLIDVSFNYKYYLSVEPITGSGPTGYIAYVRNVYNDRDVISAPGVFSRNKTKAELLEEAFTYDISKSALISADGRYISMNGSTYCGSDAYPGIWDIKEKKVIVRVGSDPTFPDRVNCDDFFNNSTMSHNISPK